jgi:glutaredoxin
MLAPTDRRAILYRMAGPQHLCPFGLKAKDLLQRQGFEIDDRHLVTREETDAFKAEQGVKTTPQVFIGGQRIGGYDDLRRHFGKPVPDPKAVSYRPIAFLFAVTAAMALAAAYVATGRAVSGLALEWFIAFSMCVLAILKLQNLETFATMFLGYDLLARRWVRYAYIYPFAEGAAGLLMVAHILTWISAPVGLFIGGIGAASVIKAVYIERRSIKCACVGGAANVPLGFVSLTENVMMAGMAAWMALSPFLMNMR